jgi:hypothetical protein
MKAKKRLHKTAKFEPSYSPEELEAFRDFLDEMYQKLKNSPSLPVDKKPKKKTAKKKRKQEESLLFSVEKKN